MSEPKKDDHGGGEKKKSPLTTLTTALLAVSLGILALMVFLMVSNETVPMTIRAGADTTRNTGTALRYAGQANNVMAGGIDSWFTGLMNMFMAFITGITPIIVGLVIAFFVGKFVKDKMNPKKTDPKPDDHKHDEKPKADDKGKKDDKAAAAH